MWRVTFLLFIATTCSQAIAQTWSYQSDSSCYHYGNVEQCFDTGTLQRYTSSREQFEAQFKAGEVIGEGIAALIGVWMEHRRKLDLERKDIRQQIRAYYDATFELNEESMHQQDELVVAYRRLAQFDPVRRAVYEKGAKDSAAFKSTLSLLRPTTEKNLPGILAAKDLKYLNENLDLARKFYNLTLDGGKKEYVYLQLIQALVGYSEYQQNAPAPRFSAVALTDKESSANKQAELLKVKRIYVDSFGEESSSRTLRGWIISALAENKQVIVTENRDRADAVLKRDILETALASTEKTDTRFAFRLVSRDGDVIWSTTQESKGASADMAEKVVNQLLRDVDTPEAKPVLSPESPTLLTAPGGMTSEVTGSYSGEVRNASLGRSAKFEVTLREEGGGIYGCTTVLRPLYGSGGFHGSINGSHIVFEAAGKSLRIRFIGELQGDEMKGTYTVLSTQENGEFALKRASSNAPTVGFDTAQCRKD